MSSDNSKPYFDTRGKPTGNRHSGFKPKPWSKPKAKKWQHQDDLELAIGKMVFIQRSAAADGGNSPAMIEGILVAADQFTIKIKTKLGDEVTYFKHSLNNYTVAKNG